MSRARAAIITTLAVAALAFAPPALAEGAVGDDPRALFAEGNRLYFEGRYPEAARTYAALHERFRIEDPALYHNLGNAYFRAGAYGSAILFYRRALRLDPPTDLGAALRANLDAARRTLQVRYRASGDQSQFVYGEASSFLYRATHLIGPTPLAVLFAAFWFGWLALLIGRRLRPAGVALGRAAVPVGLAALILGLTLAGQLYTESTHRVGVVVSEGTKLRDGRHEAAQGRMIPEGLEVRIVDQDEGWIRVELSNGRQGWVPDGAVKQI